MLVKDVMTSPAITVSAEAWVKDGLRLLDEHHVTALPVVDDRGRLVGIVSEADLLHDVVHHDPRTQILPREDTDAPPRRIADVMSTLSMTVGADSDLSDAVELMTSTAVKSLPVVDHEHVVGVVSRSDIVHLLARSDDLIRAEVDELLRSAGLSFQVDVDGGRVLIEGPVDPHQRRVAEVIAGAVRGVVSVRVRG